MQVDAPGAATAVGAILRHAGSEPDGIVSIRWDDGALVVASPGETSLLTARLDAPDASAKLDGAYRPPSGSRASGYDRAILHWAATTTIHSLLGQIAVLMGGQEG